MTARGMLASIAAAVLVAVACGAPPAQLTEKDTAALENIFDVVARAFTAADYATYAAQFSEDAAIQPPNSPVVSGRTAIQAFAEAFPPVEELTFSNVQLSGEGSLAYGTSAYVLTLKDGSRDIGKQLVVFRRAANGEWQVVAGSFSSDLPLPGQP